MHAQLCKRFVKMFECDSARIADPCGRLFLIIGTKRHTSQDKDCCERMLPDDARERVDFEHLEETVIANGDTPEALLASAKFYKKLLGMSLDDAIREMIGGSHGH